MLMNIVSSPEIASGLKLNRHTRRRQSCHRKRHRDAAFRALNAAEQLRTGIVRTKQMAARMFATTQTYITAALTVLQAKGDELIQGVLAGDICLLDAAAGVKARADLLVAHRAASLADRVAVYKIVYPGIVFDKPAGPAVDDDDAGLEEKDSDDLLAEAPASGDVASYLQRNGLTTLSDVVENS
jgi:hypothetical protein